MKFILILLLISISFGQQKMIIHNNSGIKNVYFVSGIDSITFEKTQGELVAQYLFNGNCNDEIKYNNHGTIYGSPALIPDRHNTANAAYDFKWAADINYAIVPHSISLQFNHSFTAMVWVKSNDNYGLAGHYVTKGYNIMDTPIKTPGYMCSIGPYVAKLYIRDNEGDSAVVVGNTKIEDTEWHHIAWVKDGAASTISVYVDGKMDCDTLHHTVGDITNNLDLRINYGRDKQGGMVTGLFDDISLFNYALTESQIDYVYQIGK